MFVELIWMSVPACTFRAASPSGQHRIRAGGLPESGDHVHALGSVQVQYKRHIPPRGNKSRHLYGKISSACLADDLVTPPRARQTWSLSIMSHPTGEFLKAHKKPLYGTGHRCGAASRQEAGNILCKLYHHSPGSLSSS